MRIKSITNRIRYIGIPTVIVFLLGLAFIPLREVLFDEEARSSVLIQAVPFVLMFASLVMTFILLVALTMAVLDKRIPYRTHNAIEVTLIAGIVIAVVAMFQMVDIVGYRYGFPLLLMTTLSFILWSHITPQSAQAGKGLAPFTRQHVIGAAVAAVLALGVLSSALAISARPEAPYGFSERRWDRMREDDKAETEAEALARYTSVQIPVFIILALGPSAVVFFVVREALATYEQSREPTTPASPLFAPSGQN